MKSGLRTIGRLAAAVGLLLGAAYALIADSAPAKEKSDMKDWRTLTPEETRVIVDKGTERPFSGKYETSNLDGVYTCRRCGAALYRSTDKFNSGCGWPAFDDAIPGAVRQQPDADGRRTEILCAHCGGHLGHVFTGEKLTARDVRHCVNSVSMDFVPAAELDRHFKKGVFAGGCFWGVEYYLQQAKGVIKATSGYTGGKTENPSYRDVCTGRTGHLEAVEVLFDPKQTTYEELLKRFFEIHDPTQSDGQGPDLGEQYHSAVFYFDDAQKATAEKLIGVLKAKGYNVATVLRPAAKFYPAEGYHQDYYFKSGKQPYCHAPVKRFD